MAFQSARHSLANEKAWNLSAIRKHALARMAWPGIAYFVVQPRWIRYSDFDQRPPLIVEMTF